MAMDNKMKILIPNEEFKAKLIGKEGSNIKTFEEITGVNVIIDGTLGAIFLEAADFDKLEVARYMMERLARGGKITPELIRNYKKIYGGSQ